MRTTCCICMDTIQAGSSSDSSSGSNSVSATECGHVFHEACLQRWLAASRSCPTCRKPLRAHGIVKLFLDAADVLPGGCIGNDGGPLQLLQRELGEARSQLEAAAVAERRQQEATVALRSSMRQIEGVARTYNAKYVNSLRENCHLRTQLRGLREEVRDKRHLRRENIALQARLHAKERQLQTITDSRSQLNKEALDLRRTVAQLEVLTRERMARIRALEGDVSRLKDRLHRAELKARKGSTSASSNADDSPFAESPAPQRMKRPRMTNPDETPSPSVASPALHTVTSAWHSMAPDGVTPTREPLPPWNTSFSRPPAATESFNSVTRAGYNGLGGHFNNVVGSNPYMKKF
ncbi:E3 ubiquitin-protein ligase trul-1-like [Dermacentor albipictus]|uniref:E3 ubiquitin-protein ligase trul-1-like n=1 Tax=Dermacentor albipictus TaxID=60249 RepID=UPI0038FCE6C3